MPFTRRPFLTGTLLALLILAAGALLTPGLRHLLPWREGGHPIEAGDRWFDACAGYARAAEAIRADLGAVTAVLITTGETGANRVVMADGGEQRFTCLLEVEGARGHGVIRLHGIAHGAAIRFERVQWRFGEQRFALTPEGRFDAEALERRRMAEEAERYDRRLAELRREGRHGELLEALDILQRPGNDPVRRSFDADRLTLWRAEAYEALGRPRTAAEDYAAYAWFHLDDPAVARPALERALALDPTNARARDYLQQLGTR